MKASEWDGWVWHDDETGRAEIIGDLFKSEQRDACVWLDWIK